MNLQEELLLNDDRLIKWVAHRLQRFAKSKGYLLEFEDIQQELYIVWAACRERYNPELAQFSTFFYRAARNKLPVMIKELVGRDAQNNLSLNDVLIFDGHEMEFIDILEDERMETPEETLLRKEHIAETISANPLKKRLYELAINPPQEFNNHLQALRDQRKFADELGVTGMDSVPNAFTPEMLTKLFRFNWRNKLLINAEVE